MSNVQPYEERSRQIVLDSSIAVMVLLNADNTDMEMWPLQPRIATAAELTSPEEFKARKLRTVGVAGLCGTTPLCAFKEPLEPTVVGAVATAFAVYIRSLIGDSIAAQLEEQKKGDEVTWLEQLHCLPDTRMN
jgi:hypothetical protein